MHAVHYISAEKNMHRCSVFGINSIKSCSQEWRWGNSRSNFGCANLCTWAPKLSMHFCHLHIINANYALWARLARIDTVYRAELYEPANKIRYLACQTKMLQFPLVVSYICIVTNQKNRPNLVLYLARRTKDVVSILTLTLSCSTWGYTCED